MSRFPLLRLPQLAQINVLHQAELIDLVTFSFCSLRTKKLVNLANVPIRALNFDLRNSDFEIGVNRSFTMQLYSQPGCSSVYLERPDKQETGLFKTPESPESVMFRVIHHLFAIFRRVWHIQLDSQLENILNVPIWGYTKNISAIRIHKIDNGKVSAKEMDFILDELNVLVLHIESAVVDGYQRSGSFWQDRVKIYFADWVQFDVLDCKSTAISLIDVPPLPTAQLNKFLKLWIAKEQFEYLEVLSLASKDDDEFGEFEEVLDSIDCEMRRWDKAVIRRIDGQIGYVSMNGKYFSFAVYYD